MFYNEATKIPTRTETSLRSEEYPLESTHLYSRAATITPTKTETSVQADEKNLEAPLYHLRRSSSSPSLSTDTRRGSSPRPTSRGYQHDIEKSAVHDIEEGGAVLSGPPGVDEREPTTTTAAQDPSVIYWEGGKDDPRRAVNWSTKRKWSNVAIIGLVTFLTPLASSTVAPGVPLVLEEFHSTDTTVASFIVSIYILGYAIGPLFLAPMSELYGRLWVYHINNILFTVWNIACAVAPNIGSLLVFRLLAGIAGSAPLTIGGGSIADCIVQEERGGAMAIYAIGPLLGPVIGPVAGGFLSQAEGWRWVFWVLAIAGGVAAALSITFMRETYEPVLLQRHVNKLKQETGNQNLRSMLDSGISPKEYFRRAIIRPTKMLFLSPIVATLSVYMAIVYGYLYLLFTTLTLVFERDYGFSQGTVGLTYLGIGLGSFLGLMTFGFASDRIVKKMSAKGEMKPEYRLPPLVPGSFCVPIGLFLYGWSVQKHLHWIVPIIGTAIVGLGLLAAFMPIQTYLVDAFPIYAASAIAACTVLRSLVGAFLPLAGPAMYGALGQGWGNSLLAFIALLMTPISWLLYKYGERIRNSKIGSVQF